MANRPVRELEVINTTRISEHMLRITLGGAEMANYPSDQESAYVKLMFPQEGDQTPLKRSYTIRQQRPMEIDLDFVLHDPLGPASSWAKQAQPGDRILVGDPGPKKLINPDADWFLLVGDMAALPAISVNLEHLPDDASGYAVIEIPSEADIQKLKAPPNIELHWEVNPQPDPEGGFLISKVKALPWPAGQASVWSACEFNSMRNLRRFFKEEHHLPQSHLYLSSYWKIGQSDEGHKQAKKLDSEQPESTR